jgi:hypothetical protein
MNNISIRLMKDSFTATELQAVLDDVKDKTDRGFVAGLCRDPVTKEVVAIFNGVSSEFATDLRPYFIRTCPKNDD